MADQNEFNGVLGFSVPIHHAMISPLTIAGAPRTFTLLNGTVTAAMTVGLQTPFYLPIGIFLHLLAVWATKKDPEFFDILLRHIKQKRNFEP